MVFTTLLFGPGLSTVERTRAESLVSTSCRATSAEQETMVGRARWSLIERADVTPDYAETVRCTLLAYESRAELAVGVLGATELERRLSAKREYLQGIEEGLLRRELLVAVAR